MPHDPALVAETKAWLTRAATDLRAAKHALTALPPLDADSAFDSPQAAEKAMKAFLTRHSVHFRRVHNLEEIGEQCLRIELGLRQAVGRTRDSPPETNMSRGVDFRLDHVSACLTRYRSEVLMPDTLIETRPEVGPR